jgi:hypothetical protein
MNPLGLLDGGSFIKHLSSHRFIIIYILAFSHLLYVLYKFFIRYALLPAEHE